MNPILDGLRWALIVLFFSLWIVALSYEEGIIAGAFFMCWVYLIIQETYLVRREFKKVEEQPEDELIYNVDNPITSAPLPTKPPLGGYQPVSSNADSQKPPPGNSGLSIRYSDLSYFNCRCSQHAPLDPRIKKVVGQMKSDPPILEEDKISPGYLPQFHDEIVKLSKERPAPISFEVGKWGTYELVTDSEGNPQYLNISTKPEPKPQPRKRGRSNYQKYCDKISLENDDKMYPFGKGKDYVAEVEE